MSPLGDAKRGGLREEKKGSPLRKITRRILDNDVEFECGHRGQAWGAKRGHCVICKGQDDLIIDTRTLKLFKDNNT